MLWVGDRTRGLESSHIEFVRGIGNPIGLKVGPSTDIQELIKIIDLINPDNTAGRITLICRMGAEQVGTKLPPIVSKVEKEGKKIVWACDPMHGNTIKASNGFKTRSLINIISSVSAFFNDS